MSQNLAGFAKRAWPWKDEAFEDGKMKINKRIKRQRRVLRELKKKHQEKFPDVDTYDSDSPVWDYVMDLDPLKQNGGEMVMARRAATAEEPAAQTMLRLVPAPPPAGADAATVMQFRAERKATRYA